MNTLIADKIKEIEKARAELRRAIESERLAAIPRLQDLALIPRIYDVFKRIKGESFGSTNARKQFIFVVIFLYAPSRFFGGKMQKGLRNAISKAAGIPCVNTISNNCTELMVLYTAYSDFRNDVEEVLSSICEDTTISNSILEPWAD